MKITHILIIVSESTDEHKRGKKHGAEIKENKTNNIINQYLTIDHPDFQKEKTLRCFFFRKNKTKRWTI